jgi:hypothetical protein
MEISEQLLAKWKVLIDACQAYYIDSVPTGLSDKEFDEMEAKAISEDNFSARDYVYSKLPGKKTMNHDIDKITKFKVKSAMLEGMKATEKELGTSLYWLFKYDGSSIAIYLDPSTGIPKNIVSCGNLNIDNFGPDRTANLMCLLPKKFPLGIRTIQCEALIDLDRFSGDPDRARQSANGLVNSKYCNSEIKELLTLRAYRFWTDNSYEGHQLKSLDYKDALVKLPTARSLTDGHITFAPADVWTIKELTTEMTEGDKGKTSTGSFLRDGYVAYNKQGICQRALKYSGAGSGTEAIKTIVKNIQWNDQGPKGKDSWSANVIIEPVLVRGCKVSKPSAGSVSKLIKKNITPGAEISIIMANSTIPMVGDVFKAGNGDYQWPTCACGYKLSEKDVFGSLLKCGNPSCSERKNRMKNYISTLSSLSDIDFNKFLVIDRFRWENTDLDTAKVLEFVAQNDEKNYHDYLDSYLTTELQKRNLEVVWKASWEVLRELYLCQKKNI